MSYHQTDSQRAAAAERGRRGARTTNRSRYSDKAAEFDWDKAIELNRETRRQVYGYATEEERQALKGQS